MKKILSLVLALVMVASLFVLVSCDKNEETQPTSPVSEDGKTLSGKTPKEVFDEAKALFAQMKDYSIKITLTESIYDFVDEPLVQNIYHEYSVKGDNAYMKYVDASGAIDEKTYVDGVAYFSVYGEKTTSKFDAATFKSSFTITPSNTLLNLDEALLEDARFTVDDDYCVLVVTMTAEEYMALRGDEIVGDATYTMTFDGDGRLLSVNLAVVYAASAGVNVNFDRKYEFVTENVPDITAPADASSYKQAPELEDIDRSAVSSLDNVTESADATDYVLVDVMGYGKILIRLFPDVAPKTVANFKKLVSEKHYDNTIFHRVIKDFMIQGGDGDTVESISGEFVANGYINNLSHIRGVVSMARAQSYNSASDQFFIMHKDSNINGLYAAFGFVVYGQDVVDAIASVEVNSEKPVSDVVISSVRFVTVK